MCSVDDMSETAIANTGSDRPNELGDFLRSRRQRLDPLRFAHSWNPMETAPPH